MLIEIDIPRKKIPEDLDVIVVGSGIGGLSVAGFLFMGYKVKSFFNNIINFNLYSFNTNS